MTRKQKKTLIRILIAAVLLIVVSLLPDQIYPGDRWVIDLTGEWAPPADWVETGYTAYVYGGLGLKFLMYLVPYLIIGWDILWKAVRNIGHGQVFDENFLMCVATVGALVLGEYAEAVGVMLFYQVGELFQSVAVGRSRQSIAQLMDIRPDSANVERDGQILEVDPEEVAVGETIVIRPGEKVPLDGVVLEGASALNTAALTGESAPRDVAEGGELLSGCVNLTGLLKARVTKEFGQSTVAKILDLVENAASKKAKAENFITRFARYYTPAVVFAALALAVVPSLVTGEWGVWVHRALTFLVISCPCALVISIPLSFFGGIGGASAQGILVKGGSYLELLAKTETVVFDKTGTLTQGEFQVSALLPAPGVAEGELLECAALAERHSSHPIAQSLRRALGREIDPGRVTGVEEIPGHGVSALVDGRRVLAGSEKLMRREHIDFQPCDRVGTVVHVAREGRYLGCAVIADRVKPTAPAAIRALKSRGIRTVMLTGDSQAVGEAVAEELGLDEVHAQLLPADKVDRLEALLERKSAKGVLAYVGDGVNDAPVLSRADVGIAMGAMGSDAAIEAADVVLMDDDPAKLARAMDIARKCLWIVKENIVFALGVKALFLLLGALGMTSMWGAVFADVGVAVIAILNATRMLKTKASGPS
ncbi:MAG: cadmium-translocating P-type ATPase [Oscillospiraceae bacterium]|nr:cadmium-translocating P-type ATPase [Oscillospiraceae bacterium]